MPAFVIILECDKLLAVDQKWVQNPILSQISKVYFSKNVKDIADFSLETTFFFKSDKSGCYDGYVYKYFG